jgi:hypothetical protein
MSEDSGRHGVVITLQVLLAMLFLAIIGGVVGYVAGARVKEHRRPEVGQPVGAAIGDPAGPAAQSSPPRGPRCPPHTEDQAGAGPLRQLLYLHTSKSEVWICADAGGQLFYQGHRGKPGQPLVEGKTALFLTEVESEAPDGYVATNHGPDGTITEYHVNPRQIVFHYENYATPRPEQTETAVDP